MLVWLVGEGILPSGRKGLLSRKFNCPTIKCTGAALRSVGQNEKKQVKKSDQILM
jgi:hypothetical protein